MRHTVTVLQKSVVRTASGAETVTWTAFASDIPAEVVPIGGREFVTLRAAQSDISIRFRIRYLAGVTSAMKVRWQGVDYDIRESINVAAKGEQLEILCTGAANG